MMIRLKRLRLILAMALSLAEIVFFRYSGANRAEGKNDKLQRGIA